MKLNFRLYWRLSDFRLEWNFSRSSIWNNRRFLGQLCLPAKSTLNEQWYYFCWCRITHLKWRNVPNYGRQSGGVESSIPWSRRATNMIITVYVALQVGWECLRAFYAHPLLEDFSRVSFSTLEHLITSKPHSLFE